MMFSQKPTFEVYDELITPTEEVEVILNELNIKGSLDRREI